MALTEEGSWESPLASLDPLLPESLCQVCVSLL